MKHITKAHEPHSLTQYRLQQHSSYEGYPAKNDLRNSLIDEQGGICCYCMRRVTVQNMKIEHWACQHNHPDKQLEYQNLLAACDGGEGAAKHLQHCDTHKGDEDIKIRPADPNHNCENFIRYQADGPIYSNDARINNDLDRVLNLNLQRMCHSRKAVLDGALESLRKRRPNGLWTTEFLSAEIGRWANRGAGGQFREYCQIVNYHLLRKLARVDRNTFTIE